MSRRALHLGHRNVIRSVLKYTNAECDVCFDGQPPPRCGKIFVGIHRAPRGSSLRTGQEIMYSMNITLTARVTEPYDRIGTDLMEKAMIGLDDRADAIIDLVHEDASGKILTVVNGFISGGQNAFVEPLSFEGDEGGRLVGGNWFHAQADAMEVGVALTLRFGKAKRIKRIEDLGYGDANMPNFPALRT